MRFRQDIEGLRGIAVVLVIFAHIAPENVFFAGGFVGVDIFFVLSGFLITSILMTEYQERYLENEGFGWISLRSFYFRRARRILPSAILVIASILCFSFFFTNDLKFQLVANDSIFALFFAANWHLISKETDYFQRNLDISPLQHYWSLSVEEQFYLVFPALFVFAVAFRGMKFRNRAIRWHDRLAFLVLVITLISFSWSLVKTSDSPTFAYFSTATRAWEISLGCLLAVLTFKRDIRLSLYKSSFLGVAGMLILAFSVATFNGETAFPGSNAILPTVAACLLILAGIVNQKNYASLLLSRKPIAFVGKLSYSLYLWHWPVIIFGDIFLPSGFASDLSALILGVVIFVLSFVTYYLVEKPFRKLEPPAAWSKRTFFELAQSENHKDRRRVLQPILIFLSAVGVTLFVVVLGLQEDKDVVSNKQYIELEEVWKDSLQSNGPISSKPDSDVGNVGDTKIRVDQPSKYLYLLQEWQQKIIGGFNTALSNDFLESPLLYLKYGESPDIRNYTQKAYVFGDSHAYALIPLLNKSRVIDGYKLINNSLPCQIANMPSKNERADCQSLRESFFSTIISEKPPLVFMSDSAPGYIEESFDLQEWRTSLEQTVKIVSKNSGKFVLFGTVPFLNKSTIDCFDQRGNVFSGCVGNPKTNESFRSYQKSLASKYGGVYIDTSNWLCTNDSCPSFVNGYPVFSDNQHLSVNFSRSLSTLFDSFLSAEFTK